MQQQFGTHSQKNEIDKLEKVQKQAARFISNDYKSREPGCIIRMLQELNLPSLQLRRQQQRLKLLYKIQGNQLPAIPPQNFLTPANQTKRKIKLKTNQDFEEINILQRQAYKKKTPWPSIYHLVKMKNLRTHSSLELCTNGTLPLILKSTLDWPAQHHQRKGPVQLPEATKTSSLAVFNPAIFLTFLRHSVFNSDY